MTISPKALQLILRNEGLDQPAEWPGGASGITIGIGYDLGQETEEQFRSDWSDLLSADVITSLCKAIGVKGEDAKKLAPSFKHIKIDRQAAAVVFSERTAPRFEALTRSAFPGFDQLPADAQGALVSLVYNRGTKMEGDSRREMKAIRDAVRTGNLREIAKQLRSMKRLWEGKGLDGLLRRRDEEADLVESSILAA